MVIVVVKANKPVHQPPSPRVGGDLEGECQVLRLGSRLHGNDEVYKFPVLKWRFMISYGTATDSPPKAEPSAPQTP
jgi:hypothetical protein